jgi:hypothetical protein
MERESEILNDLAAFRSRTNSVEWFHINEFVEDYINKLRANEPSMNITFYDSYFIFNNIRFNKLNFSYNQEKIFVVDQNQKSNFLFFFI